jgi:predicted Zn-dependent protease with MMP-like domain
MHEAWRMSKEQFERLVEEAVAEIPERFARALQNIAIVVEDEPADEDLDLLDDPDEFEEDDELLGIYRGVPLPDRSWSDPAALPDQIAIFRGPILRISETRNDAVEEIRDTVIHEIGHYFGLEDDEMPF